ncbi:phage tail length tape measure family protein [Luteibacter sp.]|uniref:phage tail length tape measure family protein n=1 Tax=Luteibacter sp. TaxID=1886636 RepID=UPI002809B75B|nr:phage tail length tape measure family protein [Luteibacter sp.]MDQ8051067.1 phage tail length tape measure family protein [Luteibacter sp.]
MASIAELGIQVRTDGVTKASTELDRLDKSSAKVEQQATKTAAAMDRTSISSKQLAAATRGLPAQFTDIFVSMQAGQNPLQVLLQQGGQIKDQFGGGIPALRAVGGYLAGLVTPTTLVAGAVAALGLAWKSASDEAVEFNKALILTGNYANTSATALADMAAELDRSTSATAGKASEVLAEVASTGRFTAEQIDLVARAAIQMEDATGKAIQDTIKEFVSLQAEPVAALLELNKAQHFLTDETLEQIKSLKAQGREADAAAVAVSAYANTINTRAPEVVKNLGLVESAWRGIKNTSKEAWDGTIQGFRDADVAAKEGIDSLGRYLSALKAPGPARAFTLLGAGLPVPASNAASAQAKEAVDTEAAKAKIKAEEEFGRIVQGNLTKQQALEAEITRIRETGNKAGKSAIEIEQQIAAAKAKAADTARKPRAGAADPGISILAQVRQQIALNAEAEKSEGSLSASERLRIQVLDKLADSHVKVSATLRGQIEAELAALDASDKALQQAKEVADVNALIDQESAQALRDLEAERRRANESNEALIADMEFERDLLGLTNVERAKAIALRQLEAGATDDQARAVAGLAEELERSRDQIAFMDDVRANLSDTFQDFITGATSAKDAIKGFFDSLIDSAAKAASDQLVQQLLGSFGSNGGGSAGGDWFSALASMFGGGRAIGGPVSANRFYEVGERGPEVLQMQGRTFMIPGAQGQVTPVNETKQSAQRPLTVNYNVAGSIDRRSADQIAQDTGRKLRTAAARG